MPPIRSFFGRISRPASGVSFREASRRSTANGRSRKVACAVRPKERAPSTSASRLGAISLCLRMSPFPMRKTRLAGSRCWSATAAPSVPVCSSRRAATRNAETGSRSPRDEPRQRAEDGASFRPQRPAAIFSRDRHTACGSKPAAIGFAAISTGSAFSTCPVARRSGQRAASGFASAARPSNSTTSSSRRSIRLSRSSSAVFASGR